MTAVLTRRNGIIAGAAALLLAATAIGGWALASPDPMGPASRGPVAAPSAAPGNALDAGGLQDPVAPSGPVIPVGTTAVRVEIPRIGVVSELETLATDATGELGAPVDYRKAGWYANGVVPGGVGPAIIAGHVDWALGPAIFENLPQLTVGDQALVTLSTGQVLTFEIYGSVQSPKATFPTDEVYGNVPRPELRLITCGGPFDYETHHYTENLILFAALVA